MTVLMGEYSCNKAVYITIFWMFIDLLFKTLSHCNYNRADLSALLESDRLACFPVHVNINGDLAPETTSPEPELSNLKTEWV